MLAKVAAHPNGVWFTEKVVPNAEHLGPREKPHLRRIANYAFAVPRSSAPVLKEMILEAARRSRHLNDENGRWDDEDVLWATGPDVVSTVLAETKLGGFKVLGRYETQHALQHHESGTWRLRRDNVT